MNLISLLTFRNSFSKENEYKPVFNDVSLVIVKLFI